MLFSLAMPLAARGQQAQEMIEFNDVALKLGMPQAIVLQQLGRSYDLKEAQGATEKWSLWAIDEKGSSSIFRGSVSFNDGKVSNITRSWSDDEPNTKAGLANALYGAFSNFEREGKEACTITTDHGQNPGTESKIVFLRCGRKRIEIVLIRIDQQPESAIVQEVLDSRDSQP